MKRLITIIVCIIFHLSCIACDATESPSVSMSASSQSIGSTSDDFSTFESENKPSFKNEASQKSEDKTNIIDDKKIQTFTLYQIDLDVPPEERVWRLTEIEIEKEELTVSQIMWALHGERQLDDLPEVAELVEKEDSNHRFIVNITSPQFMSNEEILAEFCVTFLYYISKSVGIDGVSGSFNMSLFQFLYNGEPANDLSLYNDGSFQYPYYVWEIAHIKTDNSYEKATMTGKPGVWLPRELNEIQRKFKRPIVTQTPYRKTNNIFIEDEIQPKECIDELKTLSQKEISQIKELYDSSDTVKNKLQGFINGVFPDDTYVLYPDPPIGKLSFSEPLEAPPWFVAQVGRQFAPKISLFKYCPGRYRDVSEALYDELYPIGDISPLDGAQLGIDIETAAKEIFGDYPFKLYQDVSGWNKQYYEPYTNLYGNSYLSGGIPYIVSSNHIILDYKDTSDGYVITAVLLYREYYEHKWSDQPLAWYTAGGIDSFFKPKGFVEMIYNDLPKIRIVLKKKEDSFLFHAYQPMNDFTYSKEK